MRNPQALLETVQAFPPLRYSEQLPGARVIRMGQDGWELASATTTDAVASTLPAPGGGVGYPRIAFKSTPVLLVLADGTVEPGEVFLADDGKVAASGTVRWGVAITGATDDLVEVVPD